MLALQLSSLSVRHPHLPHHSFNFTPIDPSSQDFFASANHAENVPQQQRILRTGTAITPMSLFGANAPAHFAEDLDDLQHNNPSIQDSPTLIPNDIHTYTDRFAHGSSPRPAQQSNSQDDSVESDARYNGSAEDSDDEHDSERGSTAGYRRRYGFMDSLSPEMDDERVLSLQPFMTKYKLRGRDEEVLRTMSTSAYDQDRSGNYDPAEERRRNLPSKKRKRSPPAPKRGVCDFGDVVDSDERESGNDVDSLTGAAKKSKNVVSVFRARQEGKHCVVKLTNSGHYLKSKLQDLAESADFADNWPSEEPYNVFTEPPEFDDFGDESAKSRARRRGKAVALSEDEPAITDPLESVEAKQSDLRYHPAARGCVTGRTLDLPCSFIKDPKQWPCRNCVGGPSNPHPDCQLIAPRTQKQSCQNCKREGLICSYSEHSEQIGPCDECDAESKTCVAGPLPDSIQPRLDRGFAPPRPGCGPDRKFQAGTECRRNKRRCSIETKEDRGPCKTCKKSSLVCDFQDLRGTKAKSDAVNQGPVEDTNPEEETMQSDSDRDSDSNDDEPQIIGASSSNQQARNENAIAGLALNIASPTPSRSSTPDVANDSMDEEEDARKVWMDDAYGHAGWTRTIRTRFAHPIIFLYEPPPPSKARGQSFLCHFCTEPAMAISGYGGMLEPHVIEWSDGKGYSEIHGGYHAQQIPDTMICADCTLRYVHIISCDRHIVHREENAEAILMNLDEIADRLIVGQGRRWEAWCSFCVQVATWRCCKNQVADHMGKRYDDFSERGKGCGLYLCDRCGLKLKEMEETGGTFQMLVESMRKRGLEGDEEVRADIDFLRDGGLLTRNVLVDEE